MSAASMDQKDYEAFRRFLEKSCGIVLGDSKQYLVASRLNPLMKRYGLTDLGALVQRIEAPGARELRAEVIDAMTTNETQWFRDSYPFAVFGERLLPEFERAGKAQLRVWSAGCSSGQEAYSLSMALQEHREAGGRCDGQIIGTDISPQMIDRARAGEYYANEIRRGLSVERHERHFEADDSDTWRVREAIRRRVQFRQHNLLDGFSMLGGFDVIFCRNVLIYFSMAARQDIVGRMSQCLARGGYLVVGASESIPRELTEFEMVRCNPGVVYRRSQ